MASSGSTSPNTPEMTQLNWHISTFPVDARKGQFGRQVVRASAGVMALLKSLKPKRLVGNCSLIGSLVPQSDLERYRLRPRGEELGGPPVVAISLLSQRIPGASALKVEGLSITGWPRSPAPRPKVVSELGVSGVRSNVAAGPSPSQVHVGTGVVDKDLVLAYVVGAEASPSTRSRRGRSPHAERVSGQPDSAPNGSRPTRCAPGAPPRRPSPSRRSSGSWRPATSTPRTWSRRASSSTGWC
jgi:hypothetical protein